MKNIEKVFENGRPTPKELRLKDEVAKLKGLVGELTHALGNWIRFHNEDTLLISWVQITHSV